MKKHKPKKRQRPKKQRLDSNLELSVTNSIVHSSIPIKPDNLVDLWEAVPEDYPLPYDRNLCEGLHRLLSQYLQGKGRNIRRIIDCGCGTGNPAIGLRHLYDEYDITCNDESLHMIERLEENLQRYDFELKTELSSWSDLSRRFSRPEERFDAVLCRGNALVYAASWNRDKVVPSVALREIRNSLWNFHEILHPGGILYVDITHNKEFLTGTHFEIVGFRSNGVEEFILCWKTRLDYERATRSATIYRIFLDRETGSPVKIKFHVLHSFLLRQEMLLSLMSEAGFDIQNENKPVNVKGENRYEVFIGRKRQ